MALPSPQSVEHDEDARTPRGLVRAAWRHPLVKMLVISVLATLLNYLLTLALTVYFPAGALFVTLAVSIGYCSGLFLNFVLSRRWVFGASRFLVSVEFFLVTLLYLAGLGITLLLTFALHSVLTLPFWLAYALALLVGFLWNYYARAFLIYRRKNLPADEHQGAER